MSKDELAAFAISECCLELAERGCDQSVIAGTLASLLGALLASIDCCEQHQAEAKRLMLEVLDENLAAHRERWALAKAEPDFPPCQGSA